MDKDECVGGTRREPMRELINTLSDLYIDSDEDSEQVEDNVHVDDSCFPPPPPPIEVNEGVSPNCDTTLMERLIEIENQVANIDQRVSEQVSLDVFDVQCKKLEEKISYHVQRECERVKQQMELMVMDLGQSIVDCSNCWSLLFKQRFQLLSPNASTPRVPKVNVPVNVSHSPIHNATSCVSIQNIPPTIQYNPPVKMDFPIFTNAFEDDPVLFVERCEEYFAVRPLSDEEVIAALTAVLRGTAKDWWMAERKNVASWKQFKEKFLLSFLSEDYQDVAARKLAERKQGPKESLRDFAYHYRALCLRWKKDMTEKEMIQAILRNCNPRLASLLRGTVKDVGELVRLGTQIEKDFNESKKYWSQVNSEEQKKKPPVPPDFQRKSLQGANRVVLLDQISEARDFKNLTIPLILRNSYVSAIVDTGSTFSLIQKSFVEEVKWP
ncbi:uncharacterized protein LOC131536335 [Onychostoma macrolepis]|uniref:uncharacterized protein LOC131536335 n=1 Tax=Onychostoma macrolepis TaxID=369639 RepID=UPI002729E799|nr:uncharacterized protein LOC131536335 [Onychostoma macrolepis]